MKALKECEEDLRLQILQPHCFFLLVSRGVHCDNIRNQRAGKYRVIYIHKRKNLEFS
jgi:hypothetical protein